MDDIPSSMSVSSKRPAKSFSNLESPSKEGSFIGRLSWRKRFRSYAENIQIADGDRVRSVSAVDSQEETQARESWSDLSGDSLDEMVWLRGGRILFHSRTTAERVQEYVMLNAESSMEDVAHFMARTWRLPVPKVVVSVISSVDYFVMPNESWIEDFQYGILQSARLTKMYVFTDGLNYGAARIIGEVVAHEKMREGAYDLREVGHIKAIGVVSCDQLSYGQAIEETPVTKDENKTLVLVNVGDDKRELNPHHSHSIIMSCAEAADREAIPSTVYNVDTRLPQLLQAQYRERRAIKSESGQPLHGTFLDIRENMTTPVVGLMLQGGPAEIERVLWLLRKQVPVVVIIRQATASGLLAYAFKEYMRGDGSRVEQILKPQLMNRVQECFPEYCGDNELLRQQVRDRILDCAKVAVQSDRQLLFLVDPNNPAEDLKELNKFILGAILSVQRGSEGLTRESVNWTLRQALRWNRVDYVAKKILNPNYISRFRVRDDVFVEALLLKDREAFVELFLGMGFLLQRLMTYEQVLRLFEASLSEEFFVTICLQSILRKKKPALGTKFMHERQCDLNQLLCTLSGLKDLVEPSYLLVPQIATKANSHILEKRALLTILYWAVLTNRKGLVKVLWMRSAEPIAVALVISNMYYRMAKFYIKDVDLKAGIKQNAIEFGDLAIKTMDRTFNDSRLLAYHSLTNPIPEFNNLNVVDLALNGNNIFFIAHPCCQRSMRERWFGNIKIKSYGYKLFNVPEFLKIYLCLLLVFPMYFWLSFKPVRRTQLPALDQDDDERDIYNKNFSNAIKDMYQSKWVYKRNLKSETYGSPNVFMKIFYLWTAPITKFWVNQLFVVSYLFLYAIAVMLPYCGDRNINWFLCLWTLLLIVENVTRTTKKYQKFPIMDMMWPLLEFLAEVSTAGILLVHLLGGYLSFMTYKLLMAVSLLVVYFSALRDTLTASPNLGPMLVNIAELTRKDMVNWMQLWTMWVISGGLAIQAVIYPAQPFSLNTLARALLRAVLGIWLTEVDDLGGDPTCTPLYDTQEISHTCNAFALRRLQSCPYASVAGYIMVILYIMVTRLVFYTLMFAMFSVTINRTQIRSAELWKYQFQSIVTEFETRPVIPPPLNIITYPFRLSYFLGNVALEIMLEYCTCCREAESRKDQTTAVPYNQWKSYLAQISRQEDEKEDKVNDIISALEEEVTTQQLAVKRLTDHLVQIERHQTITAVYLEDLKKKLDALDPKVRAKVHFGRGVQTIHELCRMSPYPGTDILRTPLLDKDVSWEMPYEAYDPATYSKPVEEFSPEDQPFVDIDILNLPMVGGPYRAPQPQGTSHALTVTDTESSTNDVAASLHPGPLEIVYNTVHSFTLPSGQEVTVDRRSYMMDRNDQPLLYEVDSSGVPINPMGRTGLRGRGLLVRWGPNHLIKAVISRFTTPASTTSTTSANQQQNPRPLMEILVRTGPDGTGVSLIGGQVRHGRSAYSTMCEILTEIYPDDTADYGSNADQEEMIHTFSKFASQTYSKKSKAAYATYGYSAFLVYRGYEDSPYNTDNAWQEAEIFNFHYKHRDNFSSHLQSDDNVFWQTVTEQLSLSPSEMAAVRAAEKIRTN